MFMFICLCNCAVVSITELHHSLQRTEGYSQYPPVSISPRNDTFGLIPSPPLSCNSTAAVSLLHLQAQFTHIKSFKSL